MPEIHPTSSVGPDVELDDDVVIGPQCTIAGQVRIGAGTTIAGHSYLTGPLEIGRNNRLYPFVSIGFEPQDYKYAPESPTAGVRIGDRNIIREQVTIHLATSESHATTVGNNCMLMVGSHLGHDVTVGDHVVLVNGVALGGHAIVENRVTIGGGTHVAQHRRVGQYSFIGGTIGLAQHCPPFMLVRKRNLVGGVNVIGMRRAGMSREEIDHARWAFRVLYDQHNSRPIVIEQLRTRMDTSYVIRVMVEFMSKVDGPISRSERTEHEPPDDSVPPFDVEGAESVRSE